MPTNLTRSPQRAAQVPASIPDDNEEEAQPVAASAQQPQVGTTGGMVPQQGGEWWHAQTAPVQWSADPGERRTQSMAETDRRLQAHFQQLDPFAPSGWQSGPDARMYQYGLGQANQEYQQQAVQQREQARDTRNAANSKTLADFESRGVQHYIDPASGLITPIKDEQGRTLFHQTPWEQTTHPKTGLPVLGKRDQFGQRQFKDLPVVPGLDPTDEKLYYKNPLTGETTEAGAITDMAQSPNYNVAKIALAANKRRMQAIHQQSLGPMKELVDAATDQLKGAQDQRDGLIQQLKSVNDLRDASDPGSAQYAGYDATATQLQKQLGDVTASLKPDGQLAMAAGHARRQFDIARRKGVAEIYKAQSDEMAARLRSEGKDPATDPAYQANAGMLKAVQDSLPVEGAPVAQQPAAPGQPAVNPLEINEPINLHRQGTKSIGGVSLQSLAQRFGSGEGPVNPSSLLAIDQRVKEIDDTLNAKTAPAGAVRNAIAPSDTTQISGKLRKSLQDQRDYLSQLYDQRLARLPDEDQTRIKAAVDASGSTRGQGFLRQVGGATLDEGNKPLIGAGGVEGELATIPRADGGATHQMQAGLLNVLGKAAAGLTSKTNLALLVGTGGAGKVVQRLISGGFGASMLRDAWKQAPQAWATFKDPKASVQEKTEAIGDLAMTVAMGAAAAKHAASGGVGAPSKAAAEAEFQRMLAEHGEPAAAAPVVPPTAAEAARATGASRVPRSAEDVAGIFERNPPQTQEPTPPTKSAAEAAKFLEAVPASEYAPGEAVPSTAAEAARTIEGEVPQVAPDNPPAKSARESAAAILEGQARQEATQAADAQTQGRAMLGPEEGGQSPEWMARNRVDEIETDLRRRADEAGLAPAERKEFEKLLAESQHAGTEPPSNEQPTVPQPAANESPRATAEVPARESQQPAPDVPAGETVGETARGRPPVVEQSPEATTKDRREYDTLQKRMSSLLKSGGAEAVGGDAYQSAWKRSEDIKNRHGGMPPETMAAEAKSSDSALVKSLKQMGLKFDESGKLIPPADSAQQRAFREKLRGLDTQVEQRQAELEDIGIGHEMLKNLEKQQPKPEETSNAIPEQKPATSDVRKAPRNRKAVGEGNPVVQEAPGKEVGAEAGAQEVAPASAEQKLNNADIGKKPVSALTPAEAASELTAAGIKKTPKGVAIEDANSAQLKDAVGKLRRGELTAEGAKPGTEPERTTDKIIAELQRLKRNKSDLPPGALGFTGEDGAPRTAEQKIRDSAHDAALDLAILGVKAGRAIADVVKIAVARFKAKYPGATDEDVTRLTDAIHEANGTPPPNSPGGLLKKAGEAWLKVKDNSTLKDAVAAHRDAVENMAGTSGQEARSEITDAIGRAEPDAKLHKTADDALRFYIESDNGNASHLAAMRDRVEASEKADPKWKASALKAIDYAAENGDKLKDAAARYRRITDSQLGLEQGASLPTVKAKNYVPRYQDVEEGGLLEPKGGGGNSGSSNRKVRSFDTMADSIAAGIDPKSLSSIDSLTNRIRTGSEAVNMKTWKQQFFDMQTPDGKPMAMKPEKVERADGTSYYEAPEGYRLKMTGGEPMAVKEEFARTFDSLTEPNWFSQHPAGLAVQEANSFAKSMMLAADTFHLGRLALRSSMINLSNGKIGPRFQEGLLVSNHSPEEIMRMAQSGDIPKADAARLVQNKKILNGLQAEGFNTGRIADAIHSELTQKIPGIGKINKFIFEKFQKGAMADAGVTEFQRMKKANPDMSDQEISRTVAKELNTLFGSLGRQGLLKSATLQAMARMVALAPQWNESLIRSEGGGVKQLAQFAKDKVSGKEDAQLGIRGRNLLTTGVSLFAASQLMNLATRGKPTWENPEEGADAKMSGWIPDAIGKSAGFFFNPLGLTAETSHLLMKNFERSGNAHDATRDYLRGRESALARMADTYMTGEDPLGRKIPKDEIWEGIAKAGAPVPISGGTIGRAGNALLKRGNGEDVNTEKYPGEFQKQAMQSFGVRTDRAPTPEGRIQGLAHDYLETRGKAKDFPKVVGDYEDLTAALRRGNQDDVKDSIAALMEKHSAEDLEKYYKRWQNPIFTGSHKTEGAFLSTLSPEQREQYAKARAERRRLGSLALRAIAAIPAGKRAGPFAPVP